MPTKGSRAPEAPRGDGVHAFRRLGERLRGARVARGEDLDDVAAYLRIKREHLIAIEAGDLAATPGAVYALGFLRSYADHLALDGRAMVAELKPSLAAPAVRGRARRHEAGFPGAAAVAAASVVVGSALAAGYFYGWPDPGGPAMVVPDTPRSLSAMQPDDVSSAVVDAGSAVAAEPLALLVSSDSEGSSAPLADTVVGRVSLLAHADIWVEVRTPDRSFVRSRFLSAGERMTVPPRRDLALSTGDGGGIEAFVDGRSVGPLGAGGGVVRDLPLAAEVLLARRVEGG